MPYCIFNVIHTAYNVLVMVIVNLITAGTALAAIADVTMKRIEDILIQDKAPEFM